MRLKVRSSGAVGYLRLSVAGRSRPKSQAGDGLSKSTCLRPFSYARSAAKTINMPCLLVRITTKGLTNLHPRESQGELLQHRG
jgi:hypothetical protein